MSVFGRCTTSAGQQKAAGGGGRHREAAGSGGSEDAFIAWVVNCAGTGKRGGVGAKTRTACPGCGASERMVHRACHPADAADRGRQTESNDAAVKGAGKPAARVSAQRRPGGPKESGHQLTQACGRYKWVAIGCQNRWRATGSGAGWWRGEIGKRDNAQTTRWKRLEIDESSLAFHPHKRLSWLGTQGRGRAVSAEGQVVVSKEAEEVTSTNRTITHQIGARLGVKTGFRKHNMVTAGGLQGPKMGGPVFLIVKAGYRQF
ncbi:hypothetical protein DFH06DRAFT_1125167 [Mycena polygramma]|nr:hypothetical protein DFH06DRAFT_1125167 [Mycena polygramma]